MVTVEQWDILLTAALNYAEERAECVHEPSASDIDWEIVRGIFRALTKGIDAVIEAEEGPER